MRVPQALYAFFRLASTHVHKSLNWARIPAQLIFPHTHHCLAESVPGGILSEAGVRYMGEEL